MGQRKLSRRQMLFLIRELLSVVVEDELPDLPGEYVMALQVLIDHSVMKTNATSILYSSNAIELNDGIYENLVTGVNITTVIII